MINIARIKLDFDGFINLRNRLGRLGLFYTETPNEFNLYMFLEAQTFYTTITVTEIQERFGRGQGVMVMFRTTYLKDAVRLELVETGIGTEIAKASIDTTNLQQVLDKFLSDFSKLTVTTTGGQGTAGYAMIPVRMGSGKPRRCMSCGNIILSGESVCPACGSHEIEEKGVELDAKKWVGWDFEGTIKYMLQFLGGYNFAQITTLNAKQKKTIKQMLIDSITQGWDMNKLESEIQTVTGDENSARMIARSEVIRAANEGALLHYKEKDIEKVRWLAVPSAPGGRTCEKCLERNGREYLIKDVEGQIPLHPYCRCTITPVVE